MLEKFWDLWVASASFSVLQRSWGFGWPTDTGTRKILALTLVHSFDEETRKIFRILIVFTFSSFKLSWFAHLTKETVSGKLHYQQWNYIFLFLCFCRCFFFFHCWTKTEICGLLWPSVVPVIYCTQCLALSTVAFPSIFTCRKLCMALLCWSYCETKYTSHWNNYM